MARNPYFKDYAGEQNVTEDITIETIKTMGRDVVYMPRDSVNTDDLLGEDLSKRFDDGYSIEMYIETVDGFEGEGDIASQYGLQIKDRADFIVSRRRFDEEIGMVENLTRPREGDLIFFPLSKTLFEINSTSITLLFSFSSFLSSTYGLTADIITSFSEKLS